MGGLSLRRSVAQVVVLVESPETNGSVCTLNRSFGRVAQQSSRRAGEQESRRAAEPSRTAAQQPHALGCAMPTALAIVNGKVHVTH